MVDLPPVWRSVDPGGVFEQKERERLYPGWNDPEPVQGKHSETVWQRGRTGRVGAIRTVEGPDLQDGTAARYFDCCAANMVSAVAQLSENTLEQTLGVALGWYEMRLWR